jgi:general secretion pathway protein G
MKNSLLSRASRREGLTLVEIMISLTIIGVVMSVLVVGFTGYIDTSNADTTKITMQRINDALMIHSSRHKGKYPSTSEGLSAIKAFLPNEEIPTDSWGREFIYVSPGTHGNHPYELISLGKDGSEGGDGANADIKSWEL